MRVVRPWHKLPREAVAAPPPAVLKIGWSSEHPGLVEDVPAHGRGLEPDNPILPNFTTL